MVDLNNKDIIPKAIKINVLKIINNETIEFINSLEELICDVFKLIA